MSYHYAVQKTVQLPAGGSVTVTVSSSEPINERDYPILRPDLATAMAECLTSIANTLRPPNTPEIG